MTFSEQCSYCVIWLNKEFKTNAKFKLRFFKKFINPYMFKKLFSDDPSDAGVHICADFDPASNKTLVKWTVSSTVPVDVKYCELAYHSGQDPLIITDGLPGTNTTLHLARATVWTIYITCQFENGNAPSSPSIQFIPGKLC